MQDGWGVSKVPTDCGMKRGMRQRGKKGKRKKGFTRKLLLEICISFLKESWAAGTQRRRRGSERAKRLALDTALTPPTRPPEATSSSTVTQSDSVKLRTCSVMEKTHLCVGLKSKKRRREGGGESLWWQRWFLPVGGARRPRAWARLPRGQTRYCHWVEESGICCETPAKRTQVMIEKHWSGINLRTNNSQKVYGRAVALEVGRGL